MKNRKLFYLAFAIIVVTVSVIAFVLTENKDARFWTSYIFTLIALTGAFGSGIFMSMGNLRNFPANFSLIPIATYYLVAELIITVLFGLFIKLDFKWYISLHIIALAVAVTVAIFMMMGENYITNLSENTQADVVTWKLIVADYEAVLRKTNKLSDAIKNDTILLLSELRDKIKYSDPLVHESLKSIDFDLQTNIAKISKELDGMVEIDCDNNWALKDIVEKTTTLLNERNSKAKILK